MNLCAKINSKAEPNGMVTKNLCNDDYNFNKIDEYPIDDSSVNQYSVYSLTSKNEMSSDETKKLYKNIL